MMIGIAWRFVSFDSPDGPRLPELAVDFHFVDFANLESLLNKPKKSKYQKYYHT